MTSIVLRDDISNRKEVEFLGYTVHPTLSTPPSPYPNQVLFVYFLPKKSWFQERYAFDQIFLNYTNVFFLTRAKRIKTSAELRDLD